MTPERWQQVKSVLEATLELTPDERERYLSNTCSGDAEMRREIDTLLTAYHDAESRDKPFVFSDPSSGRTVGAYRLLRRLGAGGMGEVYLAARADEQFRRLAAIKLVRPDMLDEHTRRRFDNERHTLAALDHPNIVKLLDGGMTEEGAPYLVMDYIEGQPIDEFCRDRALGITERLELFRTLCAAVHYAHQNLIVHRDLKPPNILVTPQGVPKLMDFGIAKLLLPAYAAGEVGFTRTAVQPMTPEYASPEQILGRPITTASDIYALGVLLYLLLAGRHPFKPGTQSVHEMERAICQDDPVKPSAAAAREIARSLRGDLDTIVLTAMRKEPQRRYASAEHLAEDVRRYLAREPVLARGDSLWYRATKLVSRHRVALPVSAAVAVLLAGLVVSDHRDRVLAERRLVQLRGLANSVFWDLDQAIRSGATPARKAVTAKALAYLDELGRDAKGDASLQLERIYGYLKVADLQGNLFRENVGEKDAARKSATTALGIAEGLARRTPADARVREALAQCHLSLGDILGPSGERTQALEHYHKALDFAGNDALLAATIWSKVAPIESDAGDPAAALESARKCEQAARQWIAANPGDRKGRSILAFARERAAWFALEAGEPTADAEEPFREAVARYEAGGGNRRNLAMAYKALAEVQQRTGKPREALENSRHSLALSQALLRNDPLDALLGIDVAQEYVLLLDLLVAGRQPDAHAETAHAVAYLKPLAHAPRATLYYVVDYSKILVATPFPEFLNGEDLIALARRAVTMSTDSETLDILARAYQRAGRFAEAIEAAQRALAALPPPPPAGRPVPEVRRKLEASLVSLQARQPGAGSAGPVTPAK